jgi:hypothetical protein
MTWHDTYAHERKARLLAVRRFWEVVSTPGCPFTAPKSDFLSKIRYRTAYHACETVEATIRDAILPRNTLWAVMAIGLHHMNHGGVDRHVCIVPDRIELFGGQARELLPRLFVRLLYLCLRAPRSGREAKWDARHDGISGYGDEDATKFVGQCRIIERLTWMKLRVRKQLEAHMMEQDGTWREDLKWLVPALRIAYPHEKEPALIKEPKVSPGKEQRVPNRHV